MTQYIDKSALVAEIERLRKNYGRIFNEYDALFLEGRSSAFDEVLSFLDTLEVKEMEEEPVNNDLEEEIHRYYVDWDEHPQYVQTARHFANWQKERILNNATEREVKVDVCGYPYIDFTELYDYDKDIPLAKEGDKVKLVIIRENNL